MSPWPRVCERNKKGKGGRSGSLKGEEGEKTGVKGKMGVEERGGDRRTSK